MRFSFTVISAGIDSVAVISDLLPANSDPDTAQDAARQIAEEFLSLLR